MIKHTGRHFFSCEHELENTLHYIAFSKSIHIQTIKLSLFNRWHLMRLHHSREVVYYPRMWRSVARMKKFLNALTAQKSSRKLINTVLDVEQPWTKRGFSFVIIFSVGLITRLYFSFQKSTIQQKCLCVLCTIDFASTDKGDGMQTVTMPKFARPFNKNWTG